MKVLAKNYLGARRRWGELLDKLKAQGHRCALTGAPLKIGSGASIDHIVPQSRGGPDEIGNLQWVTLEANRAKQDLSTDDFVALCRAVVAHHDRKKT